MSAEVAMRVYAEIVHILALAVPMYAGWALRGLRCQRSERGE